VALHETQLGVGLS